MARKEKPPLIVTILTHEEATRTDFPTAEYRSVMVGSQQSTIQMAYARRNHDIDPQPVWRSKGERHWSDLLYCKGVNTMVGGNS